MKESHAQALDGLSLSLSRTFLSPCSCFIFLLFLCISPFSPVFLSGRGTAWSAWWEIPLTDTLSDISSETGKVSIAVPQPGSPFVLDLKIDTETEVFKTRSNCLDLLKKKKSPNAYLSEQASILPCWWLNNPCGDDNHGNARDPFTGLGRGPSLSRNTQQSQEAPLFSRSLIVDCFPFPKELL